MDENDKQLLNYVVVNFITSNQEKIIDPLKIFKSVGEVYRVNKPKLDGYILIGYRGNLNGVMKESVEQVELIYAPLGKLVIQEGNDKNNTESVPFQVSSSADQVQAIKLPSLQGNEDYYYIESENGEWKIGKRVVDPDNFLPNDPTSDVYLAKLTLEQLNNEQKKRWHTPTKENMGGTEIVNANEDSETATIKEISEVSEATKETKGENVMQLLEPILLLSNAFKQVVHALVELEKKGQLTQSQKTQLIKKAKLLLVSIEKLSK